MAVEIGGKLSASPVFLAPLAGITDLPFRRLVSRFGAGLVVSEMVASQEVVQSRPLARARAEICGDLEMSSVQIAGRDPYWMAEAAKYVEGQGARIIDINMGCPAKKVTNGYSGSALMREPDYALSLIEAVVDAVRVPVTVKMRLGWDDESLNAAELAARAEAAGVAMITVHGRTRCQFYKGSADWRAIGKVVAALSIPVIANGDIVDAATARCALKESGAAGIMIGRGAQGKPWLLRAIADALSGQRSEAAPSGTELIDLVSDHYEAMMSFYGIDLGLKCARKHLGWYMDYACSDRGLRQMILTAQTPERVLSLLPDALSSPQQVAA